jgi:uncharacterized protein YecE (DUF72 family)
MVRIGCAGWQLRGADDTFDGDGTHLARYSRIFTAVEINSSHYRPHRRATYARWADSVPDDFRFSVKLPRIITHVNRLVDCEEFRDLFLDQVEGLGAKLGAVLVQLPPTLEFDAAVAASFFSGLRARFADGGIVVEPRHPSWFGHEVDVLLGEVRVGRVVPDPLPVAFAGEPGGWPGTVYFRLHGSPRMYHSLYDGPFLEATAERLRWHEENGSYVWCIFDNSARQGAISNALQMLRLLEAAGLNEASRPRAHSPPPSAPFLPPGAPRP